MVGLGKVTDRAQLTVTDNGPGIAPEDLPHIFERFYRREKSRTRQKDGQRLWVGLIHCLLDCAQSWRPD